MAQVQFEWEFCKVLPSLSIRITWSTARTREYGYAQYRAQTKDTPPGLSRRDRMTVAPGFNPATGSLDDRLPVRVQPASAKMLTSILAGAGCTNFIWAGTGL